MQKVQCLFIQCRENCKSAIVYVNKDLIAGD